MSDPARRVGVLFGGRSVEHEVSVSSAREVAAAMRDTPLECVPIGVTGEGHWLPPEASERILDGAATRVASVGVDAPRLLVEPGGRRLVAVRPTAPQRAGEALHVDVLFPLVHGWGGEDGRLQGLLELAGIPYVGSGPLGSAVAMDKCVSKRLAADAGLPVVPWCELDATTYGDDPSGVVARVADERPLPLFVKPANGGSSVGIGKVRTRDELAPALATAFEHDERVVVETAVDAREIECAVLGNDAPRTTRPGEIHPSREFYDYAAKYEDGTSRLDIPARVDAGTSEALQDYARRAFRALHLRGLARIDFLVRRADGGIFFNEANTLPGFTPISMFPKLWEAEGLAYPRLIERLVELAVEHAGRPGGRRTRHPA